MDYLIQSHTDSSKQYTVTAHPTGTWSCTCVGYGYRQTCSHIKEVQQRLISELQVLLTNTEPNLIRYFCRSEGCGLELTGTHHRVGKCPQCYRNEVFARVA
jgi:hypothetical protein